MKRMGLRTAARRKLLAFGGLGALMGLARQPELAHASHQVEDIGIGVTNPTLGSPPTTTTTLSTNTNGEGFQVLQADNALGVAVFVHGARNSLSGSGGDALYADGGSTTGVPGSQRSGGDAVVGTGGSGFEYGGGGRGGNFSGGISTTNPGVGVNAEGGINTGGLLAVGGTGIVGRGGLGNNRVTRTGIGVLGQSTSAEGVRGESAFGPGTLGVSSNGVGVFAVSHTSWGLYSQSPGFAGVFQGAVYIAGGLKLLGGFLTAVKHPDGSTRAAHGVTSTEPVMEDFGRARLANGAAHVDLEPTFAALIQSADYTVFLVPEGDCKGLYSANRTASGFDVRELQGGTSSLDFGYRVVAKRRDGDRSRLAKLDQLDPLPAVSHTEVADPTAAAKSRTPSTSAPSQPSSAPPPRR
ncbi:MAG: hypothetical protein U0821_19030 [Chloroflexota bacterium]